MKGKFEQPRKRFTGEPLQPPVQAPQADPNRADPYADQGYPRQGQPASYQAQNNYTDPRQGYEAPQQPYSDQGYPGYDPYSQGGYGSPNEPYPGEPGGFPQEPDKGGFLWGLLGFCIPLVGLILFLSWKKNKPGKAKSCGKGALIGVIVNLVLTILLVAGVAIGGKSVLNSYLDKVNKVEVNVAYTEDPTAPTETEYVVETETTQETTVVTTEPAHIPSPDDYINFLVVGQSSRGEEDAEQARFADSMMLVTLNTYEKKITMTSLLRDAFVVPPPYKGHTFGRIKLTTAYHLGYVYAGKEISGSMELMDMTLFKNFGIEVDHNFEIGFDVFEAIVNSLGGIDVELTEPEANYLTEISALYEWRQEVFAPGMTHLDGFNTLIYARMRHAEGDGDSDIKRTVRQQNVVSAILGKLKTMSPGELNQLATEVLPMVSTSMSNEEIMDMIKLTIPMLKDLTLESSGTCPANYKGELVDIYGDGMMHSVLRFNEQETKAHMREITLGEKAN